MNSEKNDFLSIVEKMIGYDLSLGDLNQITYQYGLAGFLQNISSNFLNIIINNKYSIQCIFGKSCLEAYLSTLENPEIESLNGILKL